MASSFSKAFAEARKKFDSNPTEGNYTFTWNGKSYNVRREGEKKSDLMKAGSSRPEPRPTRSAPETSPRPARRSGVARPGEATPGRVETSAIGAGGRGDGRKETVVRRAQAAIDRAEAGASNPPAQGSTPRFSERHSKPGNLARTIGNFFSENYRRGGLSNRNR